MLMLYRCFWLVAKILKIISENIAGKNNIGAPKISKSLSFLLLENI